jgi:hypothetical protein
MPEGTPNASLMVRKMIDEFMDAHKADPRIDSRTLKKYQEIRKNRLRG